MIKARRMRGGEEETVSRRVELIASMSNSAAQGMHGKEGRSRAVEIDGAGWGQFDGENGDRY